MPLLVTGATGPIGRLLVSQLHAAGQPVRVVSREASPVFPKGVEVVQGDFTKGDLPSSAFHEVKGVFVFPAQGGVDAFVQQAQALGVEYFVVLSSLAAALEHVRDQGSASALHHLAVENAVKATGIPATFLRPGTFANNLLAWAHSIKIEDTVYGPYPTPRQAPIHEEDIAAVAFAALTREGHQGKTYAMTGPQSLTRVEQLEAIGAAINKKLRFQEVSPEAFQESMSKFMPAPIIKMLLDYWSDTVSQPDLVRPTVEQVTGRKARTLVQWAQAHLADFS
ncbi:MAG: NmrA family NAD(P)-binding protein [Thermaceae bacterium]|nr:NmrA family NAD(P)-binding protein [Thermaceae bacterium]